MPTALVTGASVGIGAELSRQLADRGHDLVLVARDATRLQTLADELSGQHGIHAEVLSADLADPDAVRRVADRLADPARPVDLLVNNAGFGMRTGFLTSEVADEERAIDVMVRTPLVLCHAAGRAMRERGHGAIVNVSSVAAYLTTGTYSAAKAWITTFSHSLSSELAGTGVQVMVLAPGFTHTEFHQRAEIDKGKIPGWMWLDADRLVHDALADLDRGATLSVPGTPYKLLVPVLRMLPRRVLADRRVVARHRPNKT